MVNEYVVNAHKIENGKLKPLVKEFPNIYVQCREKSAIKKSKCLNTGITGQTI